LSVLLAPPFDVPGWSSGGSSPLRNRIERLWQYCLMERQSRNPHLEAVIAELLASDSRPVVYGVSLRPMVEIF
jgi:hypothetical protein